MSPLPRCPLQALIEVTEDGQVKITLLTSKYRLRHNFELAETVQRMQDGLVTTEVVWSVS